jgi:hypothetical protein
LACAWEKCGFMWWDKGGMKGRKTRKTYGE